MDKLWYIQQWNIIQCKERNELSNHEKTGKNPKCILLSERNQSEKATYCDSIYMAGWERKEAVNVEPDLELSPMTLRL